MDLARSNMQRLSCTCTETLASRDDEGDADLEFPEGLLAAVRKSTEPTDSPPEVQD